MLALLTSCGRTDLLQRTVDSLFLNQQREIDLLIHEDGNEILLERGDYKGTVTAMFSERKGQHESINLFLRKRLNEKYYLHSEDDWEFKNTFDWITASVKIMESDPMIIKVLPRGTIEHPCKYDYEIDGIKYGFLQPWNSVDNIRWCGFSYNPGVTRVDLLKKFLPLDRYENNLAERIYDAGYKKVQLERAVYHHIGEGRSTHG